jgi:hypothetical protein
LWNHNGKCSVVKLCEEVTVAECFSDAGANGREQAGCIRSLKREEMVIVIAKSDQQQRKAPQRTFDFTVGQTCLKMINERLLTCL